MARDVTVAALLTVVGLAIVVGPWVFRLASDLTAERAERVRTQERADLAAHLHDSVLQTLALIQKNANDGPTVARLARVPGARPALLAVRRRGHRRAHASPSALRGVAAEVEDAHGVSVEVVTVGDCPMAEALRPIVNATREAVTNAAKHAGTGQVDVYAEITDAAVDVFVRDRGTRLRPRRHRRGPATASATASSTGWAGTAAPPTYAPRPARAPRCGCTFPTTAGGEPWLSCTRVVLVDDHGMFRAGVRGELGDAVDIVAEAADVDEAVAAINEHHPDVVLLDVHLPGGGGVEVMRRLLVPDAATR